MGVYLVWERLILSVGVDIHTIFLKSNLTLNPQIKNVHLLWPRIYASGNLMWSNIYPSRQRIHRHAHKDVRIFPAELFVIEKIGNICYQE